MPGRRPPPPVMSSGPVTRTLPLVALIAMVIGGLSFQLGAADTSFDRPGEVVLLFVDVAPLLWFTAAPIVLTALRWQVLDARLTWVTLAAVIAAAVAGLALGALRLVLVGPIATPGVPVVPVSESPTVTFLTAATFAMVGGLFLLVDRTRSPRR